MTAAALPFPPRRSFVLWFPKHSGSVRHSPFIYPHSDQQITLARVKESVITIFSSKNLQYLSVIVVCGCADTQQTESLVDRFRVSAVGRLTLGVYLAESVLWL